MNKDLTSYVKIYDNWLTEDSCKQTVKELDLASSWSQHQFYYATEDIHKPRSGDKELDICYYNTSTKPYIMQRIWDGFYQYCSDLDFDWFKQWSGYSDVRFNRYKETRVMANHCDHIHSLFDGNRKGIPTMSSLIVLNNEYTGGEFMMWDEEIKLEEGTLMVFPSVFLYPHRVEPVTSGTRYSCVSWAW